MINALGNIIGAPPFTKTLSGLFDSNTTDLLEIDDTGLELLAQLSNMPDYVVAIFIQNVGSENVGVFVGADDTGFINGTILQANAGITVEPLGNNVYLKTAANTTNIVCIIQYSTVPFPPVLG